MFLRQYISIRSMRRVTFRILSRENCFHSPVINVTDEYIQEYIRRAIVQNYRVFAEWIKFIGEVVCDFFFLVMWVTMAWALHEWIGKIFPLHGLPHYTSYIIEGVLDLSTLIKLLKLRFGRLRCSNRS
jgi:hypothetical protein